MAFQFTRLAAAHARRFALGAAFSLFMLAPLAAAAQSPAGLRAERSDTLPAAARALARDPHLRAVLLGDAARQTAVDGDLAAGARPGCLFSYERAPEAFQHALADAESRVHRFFSRPDVLARLQVAFPGSAGRPTMAWRDRAAGLVAAVREQRACTEVRFTNFHGARGAMAGFVGHGEGGRPFILVNSDWLAAGVSHHAMVRLALEEIGHSFDWALNGDLDSPGDEGELFAAALLGEDTDADALARIRREDDSNVVRLDGVAYRVEEASITFTAAFLVTSAGGLNTTSAVGGSLRFVSDPDNATFGSSLSSNVIRGTLSYTDASGNPATATGFFNSRAPTGGAMIEALQFVLDTKIEGADLLLVLSNVAAYGPNVSKIGSSANNSGIATDLDNYVAATAPSATNSTMSAAAGTAPADGATTVGITVTVKRADSSPIEGATVVLNQGSATSTISPAQATTDSAGVATFTVTSTVAEAVTYQAVASAGGTEIVVPGNVQVTFTPYEQQIRVETAADGSGGVLDARSLASGDSVRVYAVRRAPDGSFMENAASTWSLANVTGGVVAGDLVVAGDGRSAVLRGARVGSAQVRATLEGVVAVNSGTVTVVPGPAVSLSITGQPSAATAGVAVAPAVQATLRDAAGNTVTGSAASVTVALAANPGNGTLSGTTSVAAAGGVATFGDLAVDKAGVGYTLSFGSPGLPGATSGTFEIRPAAASPATSTVTANPTSIAADGASTSHITVQLKDAYGNLLTAGGATVSLLSTAGTLGAVTDHADGTYSATLTSPTTAGTATLTGRLGGTDLASPATVAFTSTDAAAPTITGGTLAASNAHVDVTFSEPVYTGSNGTGALTASDLTLVFVRNGGEASAAAITGLSRTDGSALAGGENTIRVALGYTGTPSGTETVELTPSGAGAVYDASGNAMAAAQSTGVKTLFDRRAPLLQAAAVDGAQLVLTYDEALDGGSTPAADAYSVVGSATGTRQPSGVAVAGSTVTLTLGTPVSSGETVTLGYSVPGSGPVRDAAGNAAAALAAQAVANGTAAAPATRLVITGSATQTAGAGQTITLTARDAGGDVAASYTGQKTLTFQGAGAAPGGQAPSAGDRTGADVAFGATTTVTFADGVATSALKLYRAETAVVAVTDGTLSAAGADRLSVTVAAATVSPTASVTTVPGGTVGQPTTILIRALDPHGNPLTSGGLAWHVAVTGANTAAPAVTDNGDGTYTAVYTPAATGTDSVAVRLGGPTGTLAGGGVGTSVVGSGAASTFVLTGPSVITAGEVSGPVTLTVRDAGGNAAPVSEATTFSLSSNAGATGTFHAGAAGGASITQVTLPAGQSSVAFHVRDTRAGGATLTAARTAGAALSSATHAVSVGHAAASQVAIVQQPQGALPLATLPATIVEVRDAFGNPVTTDPDAAATEQLSAAFPAGASTGGAVLGGTTTAGVDWSTGRATFGALNIDLPGSYRLAVAGLQLAAATSDAFTITGIAPVKMTLSGPTNVVAGEVSAPFTVVLRDAAGAPAVALEPTTLELTSSSPGDWAYFADATGTTRVTRVTVPAGQSSVAFHYRDTKAATTSLTATWSAGGTGLGSVSYDALVVHPAAPARATLSGPAATMVGVVTGPFRLTVVDRFENPTPVSMNTLFGLGATLPGAASASLAPAGPAMLAASFAPAARSASRAPLAMSLAAPGMLDAPAEVLMPLATAAARASAGAAAFGKFFVDAGGSTQISQVTIAGGQPSTTFYFQPEVPGQLEVVATRTAGDNVGDASLAQELAVITNVSLSGPGTVRAGEISRAFTLSTRDVNGVPTAVTQTTTFNLSSSSAGEVSFYADAAGTTPVTQARIVAGDSIARFFYRDTRAAAPMVTAAWASGGADLGAANTTVTVRPVPPPSPRTTTIVANPESIRADGRSVSTITVQLKDAFGNEMDTGGAAVSLATSAGSLSGAVDNGDGTYTAVLTSTTAEGVATVTGILNGERIVDTHEVRFVALPASGASAVLGGPATIRAGERSGALTLSIQDASGAAVAVSSPTRFALASSSPGSPAFYASVDGSAPVTEIVVGAGQSSATFHYADRAAGSWTVTAARLSGDVVGGGTLRVEVRAGPASAHRSTLTATPASLPADGVSTATLSVRLRDEFGNPASAAGSALSFTTTTGTVGAATAGSEPDVLSALLTAPRTAGTAVVTGWLNQQPLADSAVIVFAASRIVVDALPDSVYVDSVFVVTARVTDDAGAVVTSFSGAVTLELEAGGLAGRLSGPVTATAERGVATFSGLSIDAAGEGYRVRVAAPQAGLPAVVGEPLNVVHPEADLELKASVSNENPAVGETVTYSVTVKNHGPGRALGVEIRAPLPERMKFAAAEATAGSYDAAEGVWRIPAIENQATVTLVVRAVAEKKPSK